MNIYEKIGLIGTNWLLALATIPFALEMLPEHLKIPYLLFKVYLFVVVPLIILSVKPSS